MKTLRFTALASIMLGSGPALALEFGHGVSLTGTVELEYLESSVDLSFGLTDLTLGWRSQGGGAVTLGFDLALEDRRVLNMGGAAKQTQFWGALVLSTDFGEASLGSPRPVLATLLPDHRMGTIDNTGEGLFSRSYLAEIARTTPIRFDVYGATFTGGSGALTYGVGIYQVALDGPDQEVFEALAKYQAGSTELYAGYEAWNEGIRTIDRLILGARYQAERWGVGLERSEWKVSGQESERRTLSANAQVLDALALEAQVQTIRSSTGSGSEAIGLGATYSFGSGGFAELGFVRRDISGITTERYAASVGWRF